ncbi:MAG: hypothetical protein ACRD6B_04240, partial [Bryobacteraceae bacterium]
TLPALSSRLRRQRELRFQFHDSAHRSRNSWTRRLYPTGTSKIRPPREIRSTFLAVSSSIEQRATGQVTRGRR